MLPEPSPGDVFFDLEGDPFVGEHGIEYLFGYAYDDGGVVSYVEDWALSREEEKASFERFIDFITARLEDWPDGARERPKSFVVPELQPDYRPT